MPRVLLLLLALPAALRADPEITGPDLLEHVRRLASDEFEGRGSGTDGERRAAGYVAAQFERLGLEPAGTDGWFQPVEMAAGFRATEECRFEAGGAKLVLGEDFLPFSASVSGTVEGDVVFAGYGVRAPDYDDYADLDASGKVVVVFRHLPHAPERWSQPAARRAHAPFLAKLAEAERAGAVALVVVNDPHHFGGPGAPERKDLLQRAPIGRPEKIPFVHLTLAAARKHFPAWFGATPEELEAAIHAGAEAKPASRAGATRARIVTALVHETVTGRNVCGLLRAGAPDAIDEIVVVGGHHDHLGRGAPGTLARSADERRQIHNGADDNASGTAGVLEAAEYLAARRETLRRSILFLTFTGEERGLLGSRHFVDHPTVPLGKIAAMLNLDMIGRLDGRPLFVGGVKTSPAFRAILEERQDGLEIVFGDGGMAPSDNTSFYAKQIPVLFFFTGLHDDYHRPSDDVEKLDAASAAKVARLAARTAEAVARRPERPAFQRADLGGFGPPRAILGISGGPAEGGVLVAGVQADGPAARAGLVRGDVITALAGEETPDLRALRGVMAKRRIGEKIKVSVLREGETHEFELTLGRG